MAASYAREQSFANPTQHSQPAHPEPTVLAHDCRMNATPPAQATMVTPALVAIALAGWVFEALRQDAISTLEINRTT